MEIIKKNPKFLKPYRRPSTGPTGFSKVLSNQEKPKDSSMSHSSDAPRSGFKRSGFQRGGASRSNFSGSSRSFSGEGRSGFKRSEKPLFSRSEKPAFSERSSSFGEKPATSSRSFSNDRPSGFSRPEGRSFGGRSRGFGGGGRSGGRGFSGGGRGPMRRSPRLSGTNLTMDQLIHKVDNEPNAATVEPAPVITHKFTDFGLDPRLEKNIITKGYVNPTPIQDQSIPYAMQKKDVIGLANTGTGKTAAFLLPLIHKILQNRHEKVLILAPTRELAFQINDELRSFTAGLNIFSILCIGGTNIRDQIRKLRMPYNFLIGTPGRVLDLAQRRLLSFQHFPNMVLDEADRMVDMGFINDIKTIFGQLPKERQTMFFTATFDKTIDGLVQQFLNQPVTVSVKKRETSANVEQDVIRVGSSGQKMTKLVELLQQPGFDRVLVFGRTKHGVEKLSKGLHMQGFRVDSIHGNKSQSYRLRALDSFKRGSVKVLIATDIAARGLDISNVSHVINYDLPANYEDYVHRIGRTGRAERKGVAISLITG